VTFALLPKVLFWCIFKKFLFTFLFCHSCLLSKFLFKKTPFRLKMFRLYWFPGWNKYLLQRLFLKKAEVTSNPVDLNNAFFIHFKNSRNSPSLQNHTQSKASGVNLFTKPNLEQFFTLLNSKPKRSTWKTNYTHGTYFFANEKYLISSIFVWCAMVLLYCM